MAEKLTPEKIKEAVRYYEDITSGKTPILEKDQGLLKEQQPILAFKKICLSSNKNILAPCLISLGMFLVFWPYSYLFVTSPEKILVLFNEIRNFSWGYSVLFEGSHYKLQDLPWYYLLKWFYITTPLVIIVGAIMFLVSIYFSTRLKLSSDQNLLESREKLFSLALILGSIFIPFVYSFFNKSILYEGVRHFLFFLPFLAIMAAWGYWNLAQLGFHFIAKSNLADSKISKFKIILFSTMCFSLYDPIRWTVVSHPHQYLYFSEIFGGASNAYKLYDMDYYGNSLREAALWVNKRVEPVIHGQKIIWSTNANPDQIKYYLDPKKYIYNSTPLHVATLRFFISPPFALRLQGPPHQVCSYNRCEFCLAARRGRCARDLV